MKMQHEMKDKARKQLREIKKMAREAMFVAISEHDKMEISRDDLTKSIKNITRIANEYRNKVVREYEGELLRESERLRNKALGPLEVEDLRTFSDLEDKYTDILKDKDGVFQLEEEYKRALKNDDGVKARALAAVSQTRGVKSIMEDYSERVPGFKENLAAYSEWENYRNDYTRKMSEWHLNEFRFLPEPKLITKAIQFGVDTETNRPVSREKVIELRGDFDDQ